jgi:hypothetical protein
MNRERDSAAGPLEAGPLRNGNRRGDPNAAPRCGAHNRAGQPCRAPAMANGRCHRHGGASTGPRTPKGHAAARAASYRHGYWSQEQQTWRAAVRAMLRRARKVSRMDPEALKAEFHARLQAAQGQGDG